MRELSGGGYDKIHSVSIGIQIQLFVCFLTLLTCQTKYSFGLTLVSKPRVCHTLPRWSSGLVRCAVFLTWPWEEVRSVLGLTLTPGQHYPLGGFGQLPLLSELQSPPL